MDKFNVLSVNAVVDRFFDEKSTHHIYSGIKKEKDASSIPVKFTTDGKLFMWKKERLPLQKMRNSMTFQKVRKFSTLQWNFTDSGLKPKISLQD